MLTDPALVAELTPFVRRITADGDHWRWEMSGLSVLGVGVAPAFTEQMTYDEPRRIEFRHDPPRGRDRAVGGRGVVRSSRSSLPAPGSPPRSRSPSTCRCPKVSGRAVRATMNAVIDQMGERFSKNLLAHLGAEEVA